MHTKPIWFTLVLATTVANTGCGSYMGRRIVQAPNTYPSWFAPRAPVELVFGADYDSRFPTHRVEVGPPNARLFYRVVEPDDYHLEASLTRPAEGAPRRATFTFHAEVPASPGTRAGPPRGTLVLLHCYGASESIMLPWALRLAQDGWRCILVDLRGHGRSTGKRITFGVEEAPDLSQLLSSLQRAGCLREPVAAMGYSYGAAMALRWAAVDPRVRRVVAIAPYAQLSPAVLNIRHDYARWIPTACVRAGLKQLPTLLNVEPGELDTTTALARGRVVALFVAGTADDITPPVDIDRLLPLAAAGSELRVVSGATHETLPFCMDTLADTVASWLAASASAGAGIDGSADPPGR